MAPQRPSGQIESKKECLPWGALEEEGRWQSLCGQGRDPLSTPLEGGRALEPHHPHLLSSQRLMLSARAQRWGRSRLAFQHSSVGLGEVTNASYILLQLDFLPGAGEPGGWGPAGKVSSVLFSSQLPNHPSVHGSPVKPKAGNHSAIPLQNQDLSEHDRPAALL